MDLTFGQERKRPLQNAASNSSAYTNGMDMEAKIVVEPGGLAGKNTKFALILDERKRGEVSGYQKEFGIEPGHHTARIEYAYIKSNTIAFEVKSGSEIKLTWGFSLKIVMIPIVFTFLGMILVFLPYNPTVMMVAGASFVVLTPIIMLGFVLTPGMLYKLKME
jgi:hypothetical protein